MRIPGRKKNELEAKEKRWREEKHKAKKGETTILKVGKEKKEKDTRKRISREWRSKEEGKATRVVY